MARSADAVSAAGVFTVLPLSAASVTTVVGPAGLRSGVLPDADVAVSVDAVLPVEVAAGAEDAVCAEPPGVEPYDEPVDAEAVPPLAEEPDDDDDGEYVESDVSDELLDVLGDAGPGEDADELLVVVSPVEVAAGAEDADCVEPPWVEPDDEPVGAEAVPPLVDPDDGVVVPEGGLAVFGECAGCGETGATSVSDMINSYAVTIEDRRSVVIRR